MDEALLSVRLTLAPVEVFGKIAAEPEENLSPKEVVANPDAD
jgi:hypothetical protein